MNRNPNNPIHPPMIDELTHIFNRDLDRLTGEINAFEQEDNLWKTTGRIQNCAGNLCLHIAGNLNTYIGTNLGDTGYVRDRPAEFNRKNVPRRELVQQVGETGVMISTVLGRMDEKQLEEEYPEQVLDGSVVTNGFFLVHLAGHLAYHLGQINYLRRVLE